MWRKTLLGMMVTACALGGVGAAGAATKVGLAEQRKQAQQLSRDDNFRDAWNVYRPLVLNSRNSPETAALDFGEALRCLHRLAVQFDRLPEDNKERPSENPDINAFRDEVLAAHKNQWQVMAAVATSYSVMPGCEDLRFRLSGATVDGMIDRAMALQLMARALKLAVRKADKEQQAQLYVEFARMLIKNEHDDSPLQYPRYREAWRLLEKTDLTGTADKREENYREIDGIPVDPDGVPVVFRLPVSLEAARNDGERWRWALAMAGKCDPRLRPALDLHFGCFLEQQFAIKTSTRAEEYEDDPEQRQQKWQDRMEVLSTLGEDETWTLLTTGVRRFSLPEEFNCIRIYQNLAAEPGTAEAEIALSRLGRIFEERCQFKKAADYWRRSIVSYGDPTGMKRKWVDASEGERGRFEEVSPFPAGKEAKVRFFFRNATQVRLEAREIRLRDAIRDFRSYLQTAPRQCEFPYQDFFGWSFNRYLASDQAAQYHGEPVAKWSMSLEPDPRHFDRSVDIRIPLLAPGAYLLTATTGASNVCRLVVWLTDTMILQKKLESGPYFFVADAVTGDPLPGMNVEFIGHNYFKDIESASNATPRRMTAFTAVTDPNGQVMPTTAVWDQKMEWLVCAMDGGRRFAALKQGRGSMWNHAVSGPAENLPRVFVVTDRPVYRPGHNVMFKIWLCDAQSAGELSPFANRRYRVEVRDRRWKIVHEQDYVTDVYGGLNGELRLAAQADLGDYRISVLDPPSPTRRTRSSGQVPDPFGPVSDDEEQEPRTLGVGRFLVEEYKKPEMEVAIIPPEKPPVVGDKVKVSIRAKYYFGAAVTKGRLTYNVSVYDTRTDWVPAEEWDWLYGKGYRWAELDQTGYRDSWRSYGRWNRSGRVVAEDEVNLGPDGTVTVELDTADTADQTDDSPDVLYAVTATVRDESRRVVKASGSFVVARKRLYLKAWCDRGYYEVGDAATVFFRAGTARGDPVQAKGRIRLFRLGYAGGKTTETQILEQALDTDHDGRAAWTNRMDRAGQYRLALTMDDATGRSEQGECRILVRGDDTADPTKALELIPDRTHYAPGDQVRLLIRSAQPGKTILLFLRSRDGVDHVPRILKMVGRNQIELITVTETDSSSFLVTALQIHEATMQSAQTRIFVPPAGKMLRLAIRPAFPNMEPGGKTSIGVQLADHAGKPFLGTVALTVYDKSVEYIAEGENIPDIRGILKANQGSSEATDTPNSLLHRSYSEVPADQMALSSQGWSFGSGKKLFDLEAIASQAGFVSNLLAWAKADAEARSRVLYCMGGPPPPPPRLDETAKERAPSPMPETGTLRVRKAFADTALWAPSLILDSNGFAAVACNLPDNLTTWQIRGWAVGRGSQVGQADGELVTSKQLLLRPQVPRFLVEKDETTLSANIHNYLSDDKRVRASLESDGAHLVIDGDPMVNVNIRANDQQRVNWRMKTVCEGDAIVRMNALTDQESDAVEMIVPVHVHGMMKMESRCGALRPDQDAATVAFTIPRERRPDLSRMEVRFSPTIAGALVDALPYLARYPYGCTEQTLNRFLPAAIMQKILKDSGYDLSAIHRKTTNLNPQELGDAASRAQQWRQWGRETVFDEEKLQSMIDQGEQRLRDMIRSDGGWGWFRDYATPSDPDITALVVRGFRIAWEGDPRDGAGNRDAWYLREAIQWLKRYQQEQVRRIAGTMRDPRQKKDHPDNTDAFVFMVLCDENQVGNQMLEFLYRDRKTLSVGAKAMLGLALVKLGQDEKLAMVVKNIEQSLVLDDRNQTAFLALSDGRKNWAWHENAIEAHAFYLKLLVRTEPKSEKTARIVKHLLTNRKHGTYWRSTRDTALCIEAIAEYLKASGEDKPDMTVEILVNGREEKKVAVNAENLFSCDNTLVMSGGAVRTGRQEITVKRTGRGPVYFNAYLRNFTLEDPIKSAGAELALTRRYYKLVKKTTLIQVPDPKGNPVEEEVHTEVPVEIVGPANLTSGDRVEVELIISSRNDYGYIVVEDMKPAGFEPVERQSGYAAGPLSPYVEMRDDRVAFLLQQVPHGTHRLSYRLRAEHPGRYSALPARAYGMYAPELQANSSEAKLTIRD